jgi:acyl-CoA reductase-like NAD-dependent aldehyde dehydrogenase
VSSACTQEEVNKVMEAAKVVQKAWARAPLWKRAELLHKAAAILKEHKTPIAECLVKEIAKPAKDAISEVISGSTSFSSALIIQWILTYNFSLLGLIGCAFWGFGVIHC